MVTLNYKTNNPRWGIRGVEFQNWESYSFTLGYLSNPKHYVNFHPISPNADISVHIEGNNEQGAWDKEGRIHYYGALLDLENTFEDLFNCSSAGTRNITRRINSNGYILSLINDYNFEVKTYSGYTTADIFPPELEIVEYNLRRHLINLRLTNTHINMCLNSFYDGYNL